MRNISIKHNIFYRFSHELTKSFFFGLFLVLVFTEITQAQTLPAACGTLASTGQFGPYDYRADKYIPEPIYGSHKALLGIVDNNHFTPEVESLIRGKTGTLPGHDISYTLRAFPNHHRALIAMSALGDKEHTDKPSGSSYSVECWFQRAITWRPDDNIVRLIYANYLVKHDRQNEADQQLQFVDSKAESNAFTHNNIGLIYFEMKSYEKALIQAHKAYQLGLAIPTLKEKLKSVGKWTEPDSVAPDRPASTPE